ncbi:hypothetical protein NKDENANG_03773 [Candidatus Entotheonellaceae bacterium PAL068K]
MKTDIVYTANGWKDFTDSNTGDREDYDKFECTERIMHKDGKSVTYSYDTSHIIVTNETEGTTTYTYQAFGDPDDKFLVSGTRSKRTSHIL